MENVNEAYKHTMGVIDSLKKQGIDVLVQQPRGIRQAKNPNDFIADVSSSADDKGELNGKCNITRCQKPNSATWYNHSTRKHYCPSCANRLNSDEFNRRDAMRMFGHDLCTIADVVVPKGTLPNNCKVCGRTIEEMGKMTSMCGVSACPNY